jgi:hypothetical protein
MHTLGTDVMIRGGERGQLEGGEHRGKDRSRLNEEAP